MQKKIIAAIALLLVLSLGLFAYKKHASAPLTQNLPLSTYTQAPGTVATSSSGIDSSVAEDAWATLQKYTVAVENHDINALKNLTYKVSDACVDPKQVDTCNARMDKAAEITKTFKKSDFKNVWFDQRQIILSTDWHVEETDIAIGEARKILYFVRDVNGDPKLLYFSLPEEIIFSFLDPAQTKAELISRLKERITDSDTDALSNETETCTYEGADPKTCVKTDPNKRDTDGDGWWDSTEQYLK